MSLRKLNVFPAPAELQRALAETERNTDRAVRDLAAGKADALAKSAVQRSDCTAKFGDLLMCDPTTAPFTVKLPQQTKADSGRPVTIKNITSSANAITIRGAGGQTIDGAASVAITSAYGAYTMVADGAGGWWLI